MKLLQITKNTKPLKVLEILEFGKDFEGITVWAGIEPHIVNFDYDNRDVEICQLKDCYKQAPLHKVGNSKIYDFDLFDNQGSVYIAIYNYDFDFFEVFDIEKVITPTKIGQWVENYQDRSCIPANAIPLNSIFSKENKLKYPKVYSKAVKFVNLDN